MSYDFLSPFVAAGFHAMKILIGARCPRRTRTGRSGRSAWATARRSRWSRRPAAGQRGRLPAGGAGGLQRDVPFHRQPPGRRRHGANSARGCGRPPAAGRCGSRATARAPSRPAGWRRATWRNVSPTRRWWAGRARSGHTLGSCGLVELARGRREHAAADARRGRSARRGPCFSPQVATRGVRRVGLRAAWCSTLLPSAGRTTPVCSAMIRRYVPARRRGGAVRRRVARRPRARLDEEFPAQRRPAHDPARPDARRGAARFSHRAGRRRGLRDDLRRNDHPRRVTWRVSPRPARCFSRRASIRARSSRCSSTAPVRCAN